MKKIILVILCSARPCLFPDASFRREAPEVDPAVVLAVVLAVDTFMGQTSVKVFITAVKSHRKVAF
ncbi:hypothetical protein DMH27_05415 [Raoultella planticola]|nr:hypothetical protein [Raoultella planticola]